MAVDVVLDAAGADDRPRTVGRFVPEIVPMMTPLDPVDTSMTRWFEPSSDTVAAETSYDWLVPSLPAPRIAACRPDAKAVMSVSEPTVYVTLSENAAVLTSYATGDPLTTIREVRVVAVGPVLVARASFLSSVAVPVLLSVKMEKIFELPLIGPAFRVNVPGV